jgi:hypothetical protein
MHPRSIASLAMLATLVTPPTLALAQRGGRGGTGSATAPMPVLKEGPRYPSVRDVENHNPASVLVDKRKKLSLSDSVVTQLKAFEKTFKERNAPTVAMYDSVRRRIALSYSPDTTPLTPGLAAEDKQNKMGMASLWADLRQRIEKDGEEALAVVPDAKKRDAASLLKDQLDDFDRLMPVNRSRSDGSRPY